MNKLNIASKAAGVLAAGYVLYNANYAGKMGSAENVKRKQADRVASDYMISRRMEDRSIITSKLKDGYFRGNTDWNFPDKINALTGYIGSAFEQMAADFVPAALATGALISKKYSKYFGAGLALYGIKYLVCDVMDVGRPNYLKSNEV